MSLFRSTSNISRLGRSQSGRSSIHAVLDVGSSKICCLVGKLTPPDEKGVLAGRSHAVEVLGFGLQRSSGIKSGVVVDMDRAEEAIRQAVDKAERSAGMTIDSMLVAVSAGRLSSEAFQSNIELNGREVERSDIEAVLAAGYKHVLSEGRHSLHALPIGYSMDVEDGIVDPTGMIGNQLGVDMHVVSCDSAPLDNLELCINRSHLSVDGFVAAPYASGLAALLDDEMKMGALCIDMGGGTTTLSVFLNGKMVFADAIAVGGNHVTMDLARCFSIRVSDAERLKVLHGTVQPSPTDEAEVLSVASMDENNRNPVQVSVAQASMVIRPRIEETFELIRDRINQSGFAGAVGGRVVLTGGASQLAGVAEVAGSILDVQARIGRPLGISGLRKTAKGPAFSAASGLLVYPQVAGSEYRQKFRRQSSFALAGGGAFGRVSRWLKESF